MPTRRDWLLGATALLLVRDALAQGRVEKGVRRQSGDVRISGETISTGADGQAVFVVGRDAMMLRPNSSLTLVTNGFRLVTGAVLSVFSPGEAKQLRTPTATIGIRGTAAYIEAEPDRTYICTCYGEAVLEPLADPAARETVRTRHHEQPRYIMPKGAPQMIMPAPMINHRDAELELLESLVGRKPPFSGGPPYSSP
jgi:hypothetical protein